MRHILLILFFACLPLTRSQAQVQISHIETTSAWYYVYDQSGRKVKAFSRQIGVLVGYSSSFFVVRTSSWYYCYDAEGKKLATLYVKNTGEVVGVAGDTFTARKGAFIYTYDKHGKIVATRSAN